MMFSTVKMHIQKNPVLLGVVFALGQTVMAASVGMSAKLASELYHPMQVMFFRSFVSFVLIAGLLFVQGNFHKIKAANLKHQTIRGVIGSIGMFFTFFAYAMLPVSEVQSILFAAPLFVAAVSYVILGEKVGIYRSIATLIGFMGILLIVQPGVISSIYGGVVGICAAFCHAAIILILRFLGRTQEPMVTVFYFSLISTIFTALALPFFFEMPSLWGGFLLTILGIFIFLLQICLTKSYTYADASIIAPITYISLLWALLFDFFIWGYVPSIAIIGGAAVVIISNCVVIYREAKLKGVEQAKDFEPK